MIQIKTIEKILQFRVPLRLLLWLLCFYVFILCLTEIRFWQAETIILQPKIPSVYSDV